MKLPENPNQREDFYVHLRMSIYHQASYLDHIYAAEKLLGEEVDRELVANVAVSIDEPVEVFTLKDEELLQVG